MTVFTNFFAFKFPLKRMQKIVALSIPQIIKRSCDIYHTPAIAPLNILLIFSPEMKFLPDIRNFQY